MSSPYVRDGHVDVAEVMASVRARLRRDGDAASWSDAEIDRRAEALLQSFIDRSDVDPELAASLSRGGRGWNLSPTYTIETHRAGVEARLVVGLKRLVRPVVRLYTDKIVARQAHINAYLAALSRSLIRETVRLEGAHALLRERCDALERRLAELEGRSTGASAERD